MSLIGKKVESFLAPAFHNGEFTEVSHQDLKEHWSVVMFYPADFTFVCPTELEDLANHYEEFKSLGVEVYSVSTDTHFSHKAWHDSSDAIAKIKFPMIGDKTGDIALSFDVLDESTHMAQRGTFVVDPDGIIQTVEIHADGIGRSAKDLLRRIKAAQFVRDNDGEVCPAAWEAGEATLKPSLDLVGKI